MNAPLTVLCLWAVPDALMARFRERLPGLRFLAPGTEESDWLPHAAEADVLLGWRPTAALLERATRCRLLINPGAGVQHLREPFSGLPAERRPTVVNGHGNAAFTAEHLLAMLLALTRQLMPHDRWMRAGRWRTGDAEAPAVPLSRRTVGLLGYGHVNRRLHALLAPLGPRVLVLRRRPERPLEAPQPERVFGPGDLDAFLDAVDALVLAVPLTAHTEGLIGAPQLARLGPDGLLVNGARGPVVDQEALYRSLAEGRLAGAALDVWYAYRPEPDAEGARRPYAFPFHELDRVLLSPHRAASPFDDLDRWDDVIENLRRAAAGRTDFLNVVDLGAGY